MKNGFRVAGLAIVAGLMLAAGVSAAQAAMVPPPIDWGSLLLNTGPATGQDQPKPVERRDV